jgi:hypothetical protein
MKKKFLYGISVLAIAAVAVWNVSVNLNLQTNNSFSDVMLANVEALAQEYFYNGVGVLTQIDYGRESIYIDGRYLNCRKLGISCLGTGTLNCPPASIAYDDCYQIY